MLSLFDESALGFEEPLATALAIRPGQTTRAVVAGFAAREKKMRYLWEVDLTTGEVLGPAVPLFTGEAIRAMTFDLKGDILLGVDETGSLVEIDPMTGMTTSRGDVPLSRTTNLVEGLAFHPFSGELFAIEAGLADRLLVIDPIDASLVRTIGGLGVLGPEGLAFLPLTGDADGDGDVDLVDFNVLKGGFGQNGGLTDGDFNRDGAVDLLDFELLETNFGAQQGPPVPEPPAALLWFFTTGLVAVGARAVR